MTRLPAYMIPSYFVTLESALDSQRQGGQKRIAGAGDVNRRGRDPTPER